jgi:acetylornithine deacetylase/succinyl-diaminopimelate desuccinylase-like protein
LLPLASAFAAPGDPAVLRTDPTIQAALAAAQKNEPEMIEVQVKLCEIPAPPFKEQKRAAAVKELFQQYGLQNVFIDPEGNVVGTRPGAKPHPHVVIAAHLDTVFPEGTDVTVKREVNLLKAPGIGDDTRGLAALLAVIRALNEGKVQTPGTITFVADVGEEGLGDLRGIKRLFGETLKDQIDYFISIDGSDPERIVFAGVGSYRYRVSFKGPGGHSYGAFGLVNPVHALGRAIAKIDAIQVPVNPKTTFNVGVIGGGTSVNSIPFEGWFEVDMRSPDLKSLDATKEKILAAIHEAVVEENERWKHNGEITVDIKPVGFRPVGQTPPESPIVVTAQGAVRAIGLRPLLTSSSTDSNVPMNLGIPAITIGGGGIAKGSHSLSESFDPKDSWKGVQYALLLVVSLAQ